MTRAQRVLFDHVNADALPASPSDKDIEQDQSRTAFLIAGYARYRRPYVWLRSNHAAVLSRLMQSQQ